MPDKMNLDYFNLLYCEFQKYEVMTTSVEGGQQKKPQNTQIPAIKQQNTDIERTFQNSDYLLAKIILLQLDRSAGSEC